MKMLTVAEYDAAEREALSSLPNRLIEHASPVVFERMGYPFRITDDRSVLRYVDVMHETRAERDLQRLLKGLTEEEFSLACEVNRIVSRMTEKRFGTKAFTTGSLIRALNVFRHLRMIFSRKLTVLEIGPGSGYLGALLLLTGNRYVATDITQPLYLFQNALWSEIAPVHELATSNESVEELLQRDGVFAVHIPWWKYHTLYRSPLRIKLDVVSANHVLCEMMPGSRTYTLKLLGPLTSCFAHEGWGSNASCSPNKVYDEFVKCGYTMTFHDEALTVLEPNNSSKPVPRQPTPFEPAAMIDPSSSIASAILVGRKMIRLTVPPEVVMERMAVSLSVTSLQTPDEEFCRFVEIGY